MDKIELLNIFDRISKGLEYKGELPFKIKAYAEVQYALEGFTWDEIKTLSKNGKLTEIQGIGKGIASKISEYVDTGKIQYYEDLMKEIPEGIFEFFSIRGLGGKKIKTISEKLGISSVGELEYACRENRLLLLEGFGEKTQDKILKGIEEIKRYRGLHLFSDAQFVADEIVKEIKKIPSTLNVEIAGSIRRKKEVIRDIDLVVAVNDIASFSQSLSKVIDEGLKFNTEFLTFPTKYGISVDVFPVKQKDFYLSLILVTGSEKFVSELHKKGKEKNIELQSEKITLRNENELFEILGIPFIPPELREEYEEILELQNAGFINLIEDQDIRGILHIHSNDSDGSNSIEEIAIFCKNNGFSYTGISDHSKSAYYARGLREDDLLKQFEMIDELNKKLEDFRVLKGIECDILPDGNLDYDGDFLKKFDFVIASVHSKFNMEEDEMTERISRAVRNPATNILGHPTGRLLLGREGYKIDMEKIMDACSKYNVAIELNAHPQRLDIDWRYIRIAKSNGVKIAINPDAHNIYGIGDIKYGIGIARKGLLSKEDVINTYDINKIMEFFRKGK